ncbi:MAG: hypothetical protein QOD61_565, partial [Solirubrobacteraceae bacterium]|nr:hypothetical protein [Solirubrobacteraceae bacterium]
MARGGGGRAARAGAMTGGEGEVGVSGEVEGEV